MKIKYAILLVFNETLFKYNVFTALRAYGISRIKNSKCYFDYYLLIFKTFCTYFHLQRESIAFEPKFSTVIDVLGSPEYKDCLFGKCVVRISQEKNVQQSSHFVSVFDVYWGRDIKLVMKIVLKAM